MNIDKTIRDFMNEAVKEVDKELNEVNRILFANVCIERFLEKLGESK